MLLFPMSTVLIEMFFLKQNKNSNIVWTKTFSLKKHAVNMLIIGLKITSLSSQALPGH